jgi:adenosylcobyric acid synthase
MILGTASHVGKSMLTAALGRILADDGLRVAPFKAQNMSLNSAATPDGREIGRAQALQAEACRIPARAEMNPILIKPSSDTSAQVVVLGRVWGQVSATDYHQYRVEELFPLVIESYRKLAAEHDVMLLEGAGSPAEINLKAHDIVNMRMAAAANASCLLVGDIDRGGVFASLLGTLELLEPAERARIRGFIINKFRGDLGLFRPGIEAIENRIGIPCAGVVPHLPDLGLEEEDSVALEDRRAVISPWGHPDEQSEGPDRALRIGVIALPHLANFTDFDALAAEPSVALAFLKRPDDLKAADLLIIPGSKQTLDDLMWLKATGFANEIALFRDPHTRRAGIMGICGGMQMLGHSIEDPTGAENNGVAASARGLGLLHIETILRSAKVTRTVTGRPRADGLWRLGPCRRPFRGYEIHMGETIYQEGTRAFAEIRRRGADDAVLDGAVDSSGFVVGTYVHGLFDDDEFRHDFLKAARAVCGLATIGKYLSVTADRQRRIDRLASHVRRSLDMRFIYRFVSDRRGLSTGGA